MDTFDLPPRPEPTVRPAPPQPVGLRLRVELKDTKPVVWRSIEVPGDLQLDVFHHLLQATMGWLGSHLHQFTQGTKPGSPVFLTEFDLAEGDTGTSEAEVQLSRVLAETGDQLGYLYDFGDNWYHVITVEEVLPTPPAQPRCLEGEHACPPEDIGGPAIFGELVAWIRAGSPADYQAPDFDLHELKEWLPPGWHPDAFEVDETTEAMRGVWLILTRLARELSQILTDLPGEEGGIIDELLTDLLRQAQGTGGTELTPEMLVPLSTFLEVIGDGVKLTQTKRLPPAVVKQYAQASGIADWWPRALSSESNVAPVAEIHELARTLGLVHPDNGRLLPTAEAQQLGKDPTAWEKYLAQKLPLGQNDLDRHAGWAALLIAGAGVEFEEWDQAIGEALADLGWRSTIGGGLIAAPRPYNPTSDLLEILVRGLDRAYLMNPETAPSSEAVENNRGIVAAFARRVVLPA